MSRLIEPRSRASTEVLPEQIVRPAHTPIDTISTTARHMHTGLETVRLDPTLAQLDCTIIANREQVMHTPSLNYPPTLGDRVLRMLG